METAHQSEKISRSPTGQAGNFMNALYKDGTLEKTPFISQQCLPPKGTLRLIFSSAWRCVLISESEARLHLETDGIGFEPEFKEQIFEVFQRLHSKKEYEGTGIGLAIVKKIVENHNGFITATSELDKGATFDIYIPN